MEFAQRKEPGPEGPNLVNLNVVAVNSHGEPVDDLTQADFQIADNGKPQQIVLFRHIDNRPHRLPRPAPGEFSNRATGNIQHATVILFDLLNEHMDARGFAWNELIRILQPYETSDGLYLYLLTVDGRLYPVHGLPNPEAAEAPQAQDVPWTRQIKPLLDQAMRAVFRARPVEIEADIDLRERLTYRALGVLAARLGAVPGRKNIVWITHGIPIMLGPGTTVTGEAWDYTPFLRELSDRLDRANVAIYPVQQVPPGMAMPGTPEAQHSGLGSEDTLQEFAKYTGGRAKDAQLNIGAAIKAAMNDVRTSYQLAFAPSKEQWDGKFHKLRVTCARKGVRIQTKEGYYAFSAQSPNAIPAKEALETALGAQFDSPEIGITTRISPSDKLAKAVHFRIRIEPADVLLKHEGVEYTAQLQVQMAAFTADDHASQTAIVPVSWQCPEAERDKAMQEGILMQKEMTLPDGIQKVRFVVMDARTGAVGSLTMPIAAGDRSH